MTGSLWEDENLFYRHVHPSHVKEGVPTSQAFNPTPKDKGRLSVDDSSIVSAEDGWEHFTGTLGFQAIGTWGVTQKEVLGAGDLKINRAPVTDPADPTKNNPAHCEIDFTNISSKGQKKKRAQILAIAATERGARFSPS